MGRDNFLYQKGLSEWQGKRLFTKHLLFLSSCGWSSWPLKPQALTYSLLSSGHYISLKYLAVGFSYFYWAPIVQNLVFSC